MTREPVDSTAIRSIGHDPTTNTLEVEFSSGAVYVYRNVDAEQFMALLSAPSKGTHLNRAGLTGTPVAQDEGE